jgi:hypothetical protein
VESSSEENLWDKKALEGKACRNYALAHSLKIAAVTLADVEKSSEGVEGWAQATVNITRALPTVMKDDKPKAEAKKKGAKTPAGDEKKNVADMEKKIKALLSQESLLARDIQKFQETFKFAPCDYQWAKPYLDQYLQNMNETNQATAIAGVEDFALDVQSNASSQGGFGRLKKQYGPVQWITNLMKLSTVMADMIAARNVVCMKLKRGCEAMSAAALEPALQPKKKKAKKAGC